MLGICRSPKAEQVPWGTADAPAVLQPPKSSLSCPGPWHSEGGTSSPFLESPRQPWLFVPPVLCYLPDQDVTGAVTLTGPRPVPGSLARALHAMGGCVCVFGGNAHVCSRLKLHCVPFWVKANPGLSPCLVGPQPPPFPPGAPPRGAAGCGAAVTGAAAASVGALLSDCL